MAPFKLIRLARFEPIRLAWFGLIGLAWFHRYIYLLSEAEIMLLYWETRHWVEQFDGLDYLQVFVHEKTGLKLFFIDQLNDEMKINGEFSEEDDHCTLLLAEEY